MVRVAVSARGPMEVAAHIADAASLLQDSKFAKLNTNRLVVPLQHANPCASSSGLHSATTSLFHFQAELLHASRQTLLELAAAPPNILQNGSCHLQFDLQTRALLGGLIDFLLETHALRPQQPKFFPEAFDREFARLASLLELLTPRPLCSAPLLDICAAPPQKSDLSLRVTQVPFSGGEFQTKLFQTRADCLRSFLFLAVQTQFGFKPLAPSHDLPRVLGQLRETI
mmetsp:Transcript_13340/g.35796  ORF Transcript_13340/g.35796 Transcript_13340/m.35796 type:complete len:227 (-) Transcript_13340:938-1618(-)